MNAGAKLKQLRQGRGWSQKDLGDKIGRPQNSISQLENGLMPIDTDTIKLLAKVFDIDPGYFVSNNSTSPAEQKVNETNESKEKTKSFSILLIEKLLEEKIIDDPNNIPQETIDMILSALRQDIRRVSEEKL